MKSFSCKNCDGALEFSAEEKSFLCPYCETEVDIPDEGQVEELDFQSYLRRVADSSPLVERLTVNCESCGAETTYRSNVVSSRCPYCDTPLVMEAKSKKAIKPRSLLPFKVEEERAVRKFRTWVGSRWFAPNDLTQMANRGQIDGVYMPYWTYDSQTFSRYRGQRGEHYWETEHYTATENGKSVRKTRQVRKTRWYPASGQVSRFFNDLLILASKSLRRSYYDALEPWDLENLVPYDDRYLAGFRAESYRIDLERGFGEAQKLMATKIRRDVERDIGGDEQRVSSVDTDYSRISFKHILLPVWISSYRYNGKAYHFLVNARSGEVQGERPYSWVKIALLVVAITALIAGIWYISQ